MAGLLDALKQYITDAMPGGLLNAETKLPEDVDFFARHFFTLASAALILPIT